ncbi:MAG TPA: peptidase M23 [Bacteroidales bacterium]|nr:peptidase M23 [Bacteroidales bacterium]
MKIKKFRYNPDTLNFEPVKFSKSLFVQNLFLYSVLGISGSFVIFWVMSHVFDTPEEVKLRQENALMETKYELLSKKTEQAFLVLEDLQQRDDNLYRAVFVAEPIPASIRNAGIGGIDRYENLSTFAYGKLVSKTEKKVDLLLRKLVVQSKSYDEITNLVKEKAEMMISVPAIQPVANKDLSRPAYGYGPRIDPVYKTPAYHHGMDYAAPIGTEVYATGNGTIEKCEFNTGGFGNMVQINHGFGYVTVYAHLNKWKVKPGQKVKRGELIGFVGNTGKSVGPHLHYEVHFKGQTLNPVYFYYNDLNAAEYEKLATMANNNGVAMD